MIRHDFAFPFQADSASGQVARTSYEEHVLQMIRQVLLTAPGERVNLPEFGCGLRQMLFAPNSEALQATAKLIVRQALERWLAGQVQVTEVTVTSDASVDEGMITVTVEYVLLETGAAQSAEVRVG